MIKKIAYKRLQAKKVEYRNRPAHTQPRGRSMQAKKVKAKAKHRKRNLILFYLSIFVVHHRGGNYVKFNCFI